MKKSFKKAFTLIELIVVISIMTLITWSTVFYFIDFVKKQELTQKIEVIKDNLQNLDNNVKKYNIFDYELLFNTSTLSSWYITYLNIFDTKNKQTLTFTTNSFTWTIETTNNWWWTLTGTLKIYKWIKLFLNTTKTWATDFNYNFNTNKDYKIKWTLSWEILNEIDLHYFSKDNLYPEKHNLLNLININTNEDKSWTDINQLIIKNIWWKKKFYKNTTNNEISSNEIFLFFENNWKEQFIKITK
jgi:prepilin-type N-terminal cleavage/methylation domain-containing protein